MRIELEAMERRLARAVPSHYRAFVAERPVSDLEPTLAAPAELASHETREISGREFIAITQEVKNESPISANG
jgi:hypothetical protein